jgi:hypothetical protein
MFSQTVGQIQGNHMRSTILFLIIVCAVFNFAQAESMQTSHCLPTETTYFSCVTLNKKLISLCGQLPGFLQYRYGSKKHIEMHYPDYASGNVDKFTYAHYWRSQADRTEINFSNNDKEYALFDYIEDHKRRAGIRITNKEGAEQEYTCNGPKISRLSDLSKVLRCDPDNALNGGSCTR